MRSYDELVAAATATGTFSDYVGDGYSVPWQVALPGALPVNMTLLLYKSYLDTNYPDGAKLHDWCYTPYGTLINVTRQEADNALREYLARYSVADSLIVYGAVVAGGDPYFGISQTGYNGIQAYRSEPNPTVASAILRAATDLAQGVPAMAIKVVMLINGATQPPANSRANIGYRANVHTYGTSEGYWYDGPDDAAFRAKITRLAEARNELLPAGASVIAARIYAGGIGSARVHRFDLGNGGIPTDQVNVAILCRTQLAGNPVQRTWWLHTVPDDQVMGGEFTPTVTYANKVASYFDSLSSGQVRYLANERTQLRSIVSITVGGAVTTDIAHPYNVGQFVSIRRSTEPLSGRQYGANLMVATVGPLPNQFSVTGWTHGATTGGSVFIRVGGLFPFGAAGSMPYVQRAGTKKVGRPFELYRGRSSATR